MKRHRIQIHDMDFVATLSTDVLPYKVWKIPLFEERRFDKKTSLLMAITYIAHIRSDNYTFCGNSVTIA